MPARFITLTDSADGNNVFINVNNISHITEYIAEGSNAVVFMNYPTPNTSSKAIFVKEEYSIVTAKVKNS